jgi:putative oxidoreductase
MKATKETMYAVTITRVILGLVMLIPGLMKLFVMGSSAFAGMLAGLGFPAATFFAWVVIISEIIFGLAIIANYKVRLTAIPPLIIVLVAAFTVHLSMATVPNFLSHLALASMFWVYSAYDNN